MNKYASEGKKKEGREGDQVSGPTSIVKFYKGNDSLYHFLQKNSI